VGTAEFDSNGAVDEDLGDGAKLETQDKAALAAAAKAAKAPPAAAADVAPAQPAAPPKPSPSGHMYTVLAREGVNVAQLLNTALSKRTLGKVTPRRLEVAAPIGQSTQGGKKARQSVTLIPVAGEGPSVMCGWIDAAQKVAELREYQDVAVQYKSRFGSRFEVSAEEYATLMKDLSKMLEPLGFQIAEEEEEDDSPGGRGNGSGGSNVWKTVAWVAGAAILGAIIAVALS